MLHTDVNIVERRLNGRLGDNARRNMYRQFVIKPFHHATTSTRRRKSGNEVKATTVWYFRSTENPANLFGGNGRIGLNLFEATEYSDMSIPLSLCGSVTCVLEESPNHVRMAPQSAGGTSMVIIASWRTNNSCQVSVQGQFLCGRIGYRRGQTVSDDGPDEA